MPLVPDMPTDWVNGKKITPNGETEGDERYGYNYLMQKINDIIIALNEVGIDTLSKIQFENVEELPDPTTADPYKIYRYPDPSAQPGEVSYLCSYAMDGKWFPLGGNGKVDNEISQTSTNPVQNKVIYEELLKKFDSENYKVDDSLDSSSIYPVQNKVITENIQRLNNRPFGLNLKGRVATLEDLPETAEKNDSYWVESENKVFSWNLIEWIDMGQVVDMSQFYTKEEIDNLPSIKSGITPQKVAEYDQMKESIPPQASPTDPVTTKSYVDKQVQDNAAFFCGRWDTYEDIPVNAEDFETEGFNPPGFNNYLVVASDETAPEPLTGASFRYTYDSKIDDDHPYNKSNWKRQYFVNERPMTSDELAALHSGITEQKVQQYDQRMIEQTSEEWVFTLEDGTTVTKKVVVLS